MKNRGKIQGKMRENTEISLFPYTSEIGVNSLFPSERKRHIYIEIVSLFPYFPISLRHESLTRKKGAKLSLLSE